jgi:hypothetical protein
MATMRIQTSVVTWREFRVPPAVMGDRDRAVLRAYLTLALERLDVTEGARQ